MGEFDCWMKFIHSKCIYKATSNRDLKRHMKDIHEPEGLKINGYDPGYDEPAMIHCSQTSKSGAITHWIEERWKPKR